MGRFFGVENAAALSLDCRFPDFRERNVGILCAKSCKVCSCKMHNTIRSDCVHRRRHLYSSLWSCPALKRNCAAFDSINALAIVSVLGLRAGAGRLGMRNHLGIDSCEDSFSFR